MNRRTIRLMIAIGLLLPATAYAQGGRNRDRDREPMREPERGQVSGRVSALRVMSGQGGKAGAITVQAGQGRMFTAQLRHDVNVEVANAQLTPEKAQIFLAVGVQVVMDWVEDRDPRRASNAGRWAERIVVSSEEIEGTITSINNKGVVVMAQPKVSQNPFEQEPPPIQVQGRRAARQRETRKEERPKPRSVRMSFKPDVTAITLDGKDTPLPELIAALKEVKDAKFEAVVVAGAQNAVVELHVRMNPTMDGNQTKPGTSKGGDLGERRKPR